MLFILISYINKDQFTYFYMCYKNLPFKYVYVRYIENLNVCVCVCVCVCVPMCMRHLCFWNSSVALWITNTLLSLELKELASGVLQNFIMVSDIQTHMHTHICVCTWERKRPNREAESPFKLIDLVSKKKRKWSPTRLKYNKNKDDCLMWQVHSWISI